MSKRLRPAIALLLALGVNVLGLALLTAISGTLAAPKARVQEPPNTPAPRVIAPPKRPIERPPTKLPREAAASTPTPSPAPHQLPSFATLARPTSVSVPTAIDPAARGDLDALFSDLASGPSPGGRADALFGASTSKKAVREVEEVDQAPTLQRRVLARYPLVAEREGITGYVVVRGLVEVDGSVSRVDIVSAQPQGVFEEAARDALTQWRFEPGRDEGRAVRVWITTRLEFDLQ